MHFQYDQYLIYNYFFVSISPNLPFPSVSILLDPTSIEPKFDVIDPESNTPTDCNDEFITVEPNVVSFGHWNYLFDNS